jgi:GNAT superfamily N-acetyltransferase
MRRIRPLEFPELQTLLSWAGQEGWNPGLADAAAFWTVDPDGFIGAFVGERMVAAIAAIAYDAQFGFIGLYICHPDWRGQGHGKAVWDAGMAHLGERTVGLDGVPEQQANYRQMGFVEAYGTIRMSGVPLRRATEVEIVPADGQDMLSLDRQCFPAEREAFLGRWVATPNGAVVARKDDKVTGLLAVRPCLQDQKVGPLFADDLGTAMDLLSVVEGAVQIDVPAQQEAFLDHLASHGFQPGFRTARMYRGPAPAIDMTKVFGITSLELG